MDLSTCLIEYEVPGDAGVLVTGVESDSFAAGIGLEVGDVLVRVGETPIRAPENLRGALWTTGLGAPTTLRVVRNREVVEIKLEVTPRASTIPYIVGYGPGVATSVRIRLLETELERLERRMQEMREELERLKEAP